MEKLKLALLVELFSIVSLKVELELRMDTACPNYSRSKGEQVKMSCTNTKTNT